MRSERQGEFQAALALLAAVVGAGFASGREILRFFSIFGNWSWIGCVVAAAALAGLSGWAAHLANRLGARDLGTLCKKALGGAGGVAAAWVNGLLLTVTAGAMLAGMGELVSLALPVHHAYEIGIGLSALIAMILARRGMNALASIGGLLVPACVLLYGLLLKMPLPDGARVATPPTAWRAIPLALGYASMNAALGSGVVCEMGYGRTPRVIARICALSGIMLLALLAAINAVLLPRVAELQDAALPIVMLSRSLGATGYWLCLVVLSLAVMTTLVALLRILARMLGQAVPEPASWLLSLALALGTGLLGFSQLVGGLYPALGAASTLLFLAIILKPLKVCSHPDNNCAIHSLPTITEGSARHEPNDGSKSVSP